MDRTEIGVVDSGEECPVSGYWLYGVEGCMFIIKKGDLMPYHNGKSVSWVYLGEALNEKSGG